MPALILRALPARYLLLDLRQFLLQVAVLSFAVFPLERSLDQIVLPSSRTEPSDANSTRIDPALRARRDNARLRLRRCSPYANRQTHTKDHRGSLNRSVHHFPS